MYLIKQLVGALCLQQFSPAPSLWSYRECFTREWGIIQSRAAYKSVLLTKTACLVQKGKSEIGKLYKICFSQYRKWMFFFVFFCKRTVKCCSHICAYKPRTVQEASFSRGYKSKASAQISLRHLCCIIAFKFPLFEQNSIQCWGLGTWRTGVALHNHVENQFSAQSRELKRFLIVPELFVVMENLPSTPASSYQLYE